MAGGLSVLLLLAHQCCCSDGLTAIDNPRGTGPTCFKKKDRVTIYSTPCLLLSSSLALPTLIHPAGK